jgi:hypothetical protein
LSIMKRPFTLVALLAVTFISGAIGFKQGQRSQIASRETDETSSYVTQMKRFKTEALSKDKVKAEIALWLQLGEQLAMRRRGNASFPPELVAIDAAYTYARLSELFREQKDETKSAALLAEAVALCKEVWSKGCRPEELLVMARVINEREKP